MCSLPGSGLEPVSPALAGGCLSALPPGKSQIYAFSFLEINLLFIWLRGGFSGGTQESSIFIVARRIVALWDLVP